MQDGKPIGHPIKYKLGKLHKLKIVLFLDGSSGEERLINFSIGAHVRL